MVCFPRYSAGSNSRNESMRTAWLQKTIITVWRWENCNHYTIFNPPQKYGQLERLLIRQSVCKLKLFRGVSKLIEIWSLLRAFQPALLSHDKKRNTAIPSDFPKIMKKEPSRKPHVRQEINFGICQIKSVHFILCTHVYNFFSFFRIKKKQHKKLQLIASIFIISFWKFILIKRYLYLDKLFKGREHTN